MDDQLVTPAYLVNSFLMAGSTKPGELRFEDGFIAFTVRDGRLVFRAPVQEVRASFPKGVLLFPGSLIPRSGIGMRLTIHRDTYRLSFVPVTCESEATSGWSNVGGSLMWGPGRKWSWSVSPRDIPPARAAVRQWRAALGQPTTSLS